MEKPHLETEKLLISNCLPYLCFSHCIGMWALVFPPASYVTLDKILSMSSSYAPHLKIETKK